MFRYFARYVDILKSEGQMDRFTSVPLTRNNN